MGRLTAGVVVFVVTLGSTVGTASAFNCPVAIKQAEDMIKKAEGKATADTRGLLDEAKKLVAEAKVHHEKASTKRDHGDAIRKAKTATAFAEEVITLAAP